jgi:hypothetical protein
MKIITNIHLNGCSSILITKKTNFKDSHKSSYNWSYLNYGSRGPEIQPNLLPVVFFNILSVVSISSQFAGPKYAKSIRLFLFKKKKKNTLARRGGQWIGLGRCGPKTTIQPKPRVEKESPHRTITGPSIIRVRAKRVRLERMDFYGLGQL